MPALIRARPPETFHQTDAQDDEYVTFGHSKALSHSDDDENARSLHSFIAPPVVLTTAKPPSVPSAEINSSTNLRTRQSDVKAALQISSLTSGRTESSFQIECSQDHCPFFRHGDCALGGLCDRAHVSCPDSISCGEPTCPLGHPRGRREFCKDPDLCWNHECKLAHSKSWPGFCREVQDCKNFSCEYTHSESRVKCCLNGFMCFDNACPFLHPIHWNPCPGGERCEDYECSGSHPEQRLQNCTRDCFNPSCRYLHPRTRQLCESGAFCSSSECMLTHSPGRKKPCPFALRCWEVSSC